jgi:hypothetical protein
MIGQSDKEKLAKRTPVNYVYWSYFRINRVKTLTVNPLQPRRSLDYVVAVLTTNF